MWHWLPKSKLLNDPVARASISIACSLHILFFLGCFVMQYLRPVTRIAINKDALSDKQVTIIINPKIKPGLYTSAQTAPAYGAPTPAASSTPKKAVTQPKTTVVTAPKPVQKSVKKPPVKKAPAKKKTASSSLRQGSGGQEKKAIAQKKVEKKVSTQKQPSKSPKETVTKKVEPLPVQQPTVSEAPASLAQLPDALPALAGVEGPILVARSATDAADMSVSLAIQQELLRVWRPPVGVDTTVSCQLRITLDAQGKLQKVDVIHPSGMILFDTSARAAVQQAVWPRAVWGTTLELCLQ